MHVRSMSASRRMSLPGVSSRHRQAVFAQLTEEGHAATDILISHRFSTVRMAGDVLDLQDGDIGEEGDHDSLMAHDGLYAQMFRLQARGYVE
jgi:ATP-binding cassette subfamily B protein